MLAVVIAGGALWYQQHRHEDPHIHYDRFDLPAFDAYVYVAMADHPAFFTVAPWGYRILTPWLVRALPIRNVARGFRYLTLSALTLSGALLFLFLRRLGHGEWPSLLAVAAFALSGPVGESIKYRFLVEPLTLALQVGFLLALEAQAGLAILALVAALGTLSKEFFLLLLPLVYFSRRRAGNASALAAAGIVALPALFLTLSLRLWWTPQIRVPHPPVGRELFEVGLAVLRDSWGETWRAALLGGLTPLALAGAIRAQARPFLRRYGYLVAVTAALPFIAWVNVPSSRPVALFGSNVLRLLISALPLVLPLALHALDRVWPHVGSPAPLPRGRPWTSRLAAAGVVAGMAWPFLVLDRYRRVDLQGPRDGPQVLATCRETLRTANRLQRGLAVSFDAERYRFVWGVSDPGELSRMRWFLREGWGPLAHYGTRDIRMRQPRAELLLPCFRPKDLELVLEMDAPAETRLQALVNGRAVGEIRVSPQASQTALKVPATVLFRGDNLLALVQTEGAPTPGPRLLSLTLHMQAPSPVFIPRARGATGLSVWWDTGPTPVTVWGSAPGWGAGPGSEPARGSGRAKGSGSDTDQGRGKAGDRDKGWDAAPGRDWERGS